MCLWNGARYGPSYYWSLIAICTRAFDWYQHRWHWMTLKAITHSVTLCACLSEPISKIWMTIDPYHQRWKCSAETLLYKGIRVMPIFGGFARYGASNESGVVENCDFCFLRSLDLSHVVHTRIWHQNYYVWVCSPPMGLHWHRNRWSWITLNSHFALNTVLRVDLFSMDATFSNICLVMTTTTTSMDALILRRDCFKIDGDVLYIYCQRQKCSPRSVVSGDISVMPMFVKVCCWGGVKWECSRRKCEFSLPIAIPSVWSSPLALHIKIYTLRAVSRRQHDSCYN